MSLKVAKFLFSFRQFQHRFDKCRFSTYHQLKTPDSFDKILLIYRDILLIKEFKMDQIDRRINYFEIFEETKKICSNSSNITINENENFQVFDIYTLPMKIPKIFRQQVKIEVQNQDTISMALRYKNDLGLNPLVLNMASDKSPGGGNLFLGTSQEEQLLCCTNLSQSLVQDLYPFDKNWVIYSPDITIIRDGNYQLLPFEKWTKISVLSVAAPRCPGVTKDSQKHENFRYVSHQRNMQSKIDAIFKVASDHDHDSIILGAIGCGSNKNPVDSIVDIFKRCFKVNRHKFKLIGFAIYQPFPQMSKDKNLFERFHKEFNNFDFTQFDKV